MRKIIAFILMLLMFCSLDIYSSGRQDKTGNKSKIEKTSKKRAVSKTAPSRKKTQRKAQKQRIKNHNQKKTNIMRKG